MNYIRAVYAGIFVFVAMDRGLGGETIPKRIRRTYEECSIRELVEQGQISATYPVMESSSDNGSKVSAE